MKRVVAVVVVLLLAGAARAQEAAPALREQAVDDANEWFFGLGTALVIVLPIVLMAVLAIRRGKTRESSLPRFDDENFERDVLESQVPVLIHFAREWNIANAAAKSQTEVLAYMNRGAVRVGYLDVDQCPRVMERLPGFEPPAYLLFYRGRKLFHRPGLQQAEALQQDIDRALSREGF